MDKFSEHRQVLDSWVITPRAGHGLKQSNRQKAQPIPENSSTENPKYFYNRFAFLKKHQMLSLRFDETFCWNSVTNVDYRFTVTSSGIKTLAILWYAQAWRIRPLQIYNIF